MRTIIEEDGRVLMIATGKIASTSLTTSLQEDLDGDNVEAEAVGRRSRNAKEADQVEEAEAEVAINLVAPQRFTQTSASPRCVLLVRTDIITRRLDLKRSKPSPSPGLAFRAKV